MFFPILTFVDPVQGADKNEKLFVGHGFNDKRYAGIAKKREMRHGVVNVVICEFPDRVAAQKYCDEYNNYQNS